MEFDTKRIDLSGRWFTVETPKEQIDHIDLDPGNNRIANLREAMQSGRRPLGGSGAHA